MQPLINVLEGTMVERLGDQQAKLAGPDSGSPSQSAERMKPGERPGDRPAIATGQKEDETVGKNPSEQEDSTQEKKKRTDKGQPEK